MKAPPVRKDEKLQAEPAPANVVPKSEPAEAGLRGLVSGLAQRVAEGVTQDDDFEDGPAEDEPAAAAECPPVEEEAPRAEDEAPKPESEDDIDDQEPAAAGDAGTAEDDDVEEPAEGDEDK